MHNAINEYQLRLDIQRFLCPVYYLFTRSFISHLGGVTIIMRQPPSLSQLTLPEGAQPRMHHTATALSLERGKMQVTMFGGCTTWKKGISHNAQQKLANTTVLEFGEH